MAAVMTGVDPYKGSHTAVAVSVTEEQLGKLRVRTSGEQVRQLTEWAASWPERTWAVEGACGLGHLLAQQLIAAGERVLDVQPKLGARVRLLAAGDTNKNDPNDARSVAIAALRSADCRQVQADDHTAVLKLWSKRHRDLGRSRNQVTCRLRAVLCELASDFLEDLRRLDEQMKQTKKKLAAAVKASGTTLTEIFGIGPVIAAIVLGEAEDVSRIPDRDHFAAYNGTAPIEVSSGRRKVHRLSRRGNRRVNHAIHMAAITQIRHAHSEGRAYYDKKLAEGKTPKEACAPSNGAPATPSTGGGALMPAAPPSDLRRSRAREGKRGTALTPARPAHTPDAGSSAQPLSDLSPPYAPAPVTQPEERSSRASNAPNHLTQRGFVMPRSLGPGDY